MPTATIINPNPILYTATNRLDVRNALQHFESLKERHDALLATADFLNEEIELLIENNLLNSAIIKMSQVVLLEDESLIIERLMMKQGIL